MKIPMREPVGRNLPYDEKNLNARRGDRMFREDGKVFRLENNYQRRFPVVGPNLHPTEMKPPKSLAGEKVKAVLDIETGTGYWEIQE